MTEKIVSKLENRAIKISKVRHGGKKKRFVIVELLNIKDKEQILKAAKEK